MYWLLLWRLFGPRLARCAGGHDHDRLLGHKPVQQARQVAPETRVAGVCTGPHRDARPPSPRQADRANPKIGHQSNRAHDFELLDNEIVMNIAPPLGWLALDVVLAHPTVIAKSQPDA